ncbi:transcription factor adf-1 [Plakobranchus ocellatus]|uniref:Transcription factor adf-1 n=1 Tax=Plakobranchus ocellatus TaxID=259542 RepID=A0AAV4B950_9GAST|nr:transcription factor adf-1 [Plakobranchus ocellatus]
MSAILRNISENLVHEVRLRPCLYNPKIPGYRDRDKIDALWQEVANAIGLTAYQAKKRWQNIRSSFSRSLGSQLQDALRKPFYLEDHLDFLRPYMNNPAGDGDDASETEIKLNFDDKGYFTRESSGSPSPDTSHHLVIQSRLKSNELVQEMVHENGAGNHTVSKNVSKPGTRKRTAQQSFSDDDDWLDETSAYSVAKKERSPESNSDRQFLKGLLPFIAQLNKQKKRFYFQKISTLLFSTLNDQDEEKQT